LLFRRRARFAVPSVVHFHDTATAQGYQ